MKRFDEFGEVFIFPLESELLVRGGRIHYSARLPASLHVRTGQLVDAIAACLVMRLRRALGADWVPSAVWLPRPRPDDDAPYKRVFGESTSFDAQGFQLVLSARDGDARMPAGWPGIETTVLTAAKAVLAEHQIQGDFVGRVRRFVTDGLAHDANVSLGVIAARMKMKPRSLQWRLGRHNVTFDQLVQDVRRTTAEQLLRGSDLQVRDISHRLGFSEASAFTRWARTHLGETPRRFRQRHLQSSERLPGDAGHQGRSGE
jgi:AraC-like DNA-binding protein